MDADNEVSRYIGAASVERLKNSFDGNLLTAHINNDEGTGWAGVDFALPTVVKRVLVTPCGDGNTIEPGDTYELYFWDDDDWQSLGTKVAETVSLHYDNIPKNALLLLVDKTKGQEHRVFRITCDGKQQFM